MTSVPREGTANPPPDVIRAKAMLLQHKQQGRATLILLYRTWFSGQVVGLRGAPEGLLIPGGACGVGAAVSVLLDQPFGVVAGDEGADGIPHLVDGPEDAAVHDLLLQRAEEALDDAIR